MYNSGLIDNKITETKQNVRQKTMLLLRKIVSIE